jgi:outer membrane protein insertion porin family
MRLDNVGVHNVPTYAPIQFQSVLGNSNYLAGLRGGIKYDNRNSFLRPTSGEVLEASFEEVVGTFDFPSVSLQANKYWTLYERPDHSGQHVLAARSQASLVGSHAPVFETLYAGGFQTMRGFQFRGVGPNVDGFMVGGDFMWLNSIEYQIPVLANDGLYMVGFVDSGTVNPTVSLADYRVSAGVGVRVVVPMLGPQPIALDFGFPIHKASTDRTQVFSFWVGFFH